MFRSHMSDLHGEIKQLIVQSLELEDVTPSDIDSDAPLFAGNGDVEGLGLDSIDALELAMAISKTYGVTLKGDDEASREILRSVTSLANHIAQQRSAP